MQPSDKVPPIDAGPVGSPPEKLDPDFGMPSQDSRTLAMLAHLLGALTGFLGPLIIWLVKKDTDPFVDDQGKEALNFQLTILIIAFGCIGLAIVSCGFLFFLPIVPAVLDWVFSIMAAMEANKGVAYRYPFVLRMIN